MATNLAAAATQDGDARPVPTLDGVTSNPRDAAAGARRHARAVEIHAQIHALHARQVAVVDIARQVGVGRQTVYRYLRRTAPPERTTVRVGRPHVLDRFKPYVVQRWNEGCRNARQIWRELHAQGYQHSWRTVAWFVAELRKDTGSGRGWRSAPAAAIYTSEGERKRPLTARQAAHVFLRRAERRSAWEEAYRTQLCALEPAIAHVDALVHGFVTMVRQRQGARLDQWLEEVETSQVPDLCSFAASLRKDYAAVRAGLTMAYSNGQTEAQIHRLKLLKRQMYGRAGFELLRKRVLYREPPLPVRACKRTVVDQLVA